MLVVVGRPAGWLAGWLGAKPENGSENEKFQTQLTRTPLREVNTQKREHNGHVCLGKRSNAYAQT